MIISFTIVIKTMNEKKRIAKIKMTDQSKYEISEEKKSLIF